MHLDQQCISPGSDGRSRHRRNLVATPRSMRRICRHRQVRELVNDRNRRNIHGVPRVGLKGSNAALAQDHVVVSAGHNVFRRQQHLLQRCGDPTLQQHRLAYLAQFAQQIEILHVARAHLQNIHVR